MLANNNLKVCHMLVKRDFKFHRSKNGILILVVMLVTALYTFIFLLGSSVEKAFLLNYQYTYGSTCDVIYTGLTERQADAIAGHGNVKKSVRIGIAGQIADPLIGQRLVRLAVADRDYAETVLSVPTTGNLPEISGEIALDEFTMDSLGVAHKLGAPVKLRWTDVEGNDYISEFKLCGWWAGPTNFSEACAWISNSTVQESFPGCQDHISRNITLGVHFYRSENAEQQAASILEEEGIAEISFTTNTVCNPARLKEAKQEAMPFYFSLIPVLPCGYLMIYSIIHVTASRDTLYYAGLKSLGMTPRQVRRLFLEHGCVVFLISFLPGWIVGFILHFFITGRVVIGMVENPALYFLTWPPFVLAALCTFFTTASAYLIPTIRLSHMTPVQTVISTIDRLPRHRSSVDGHTTLGGLALHTLRRNRLRTFLAAFALLIATVLLSFVRIRYISFCEEIYISAFSPWDYSLTDGSAYLNLQQYNEQNTSITKETVQEIRSCSEVTAVSVLKTHEIDLTASDELRRRIVDYYDQPYDGTVTLREVHAGYPDWTAGMERLEQTGRYTGLVIGLDGAYLQYVLDNCPFTSGCFDAEAFACGDYVLAAGIDSEGISTPAEGETVELHGHTYTVLGSVRNDDQYISGANSPKAAFHIAYLMPVEQFDDLFPGQGYRQLAIDIDPKGQAGFETFLERYERSLNRGIGIRRRSEYQRNFKVSTLNTVLPELIVALILLGIALTNFVNMLVVKTFGRKVEFAVYESLGMTISQLRYLMFLEGIFHAMLMSVLLVPAVVFFSANVMPDVLEAMNSWAVVYRFSLLPLWLILPSVFFLSVAVPFICLRFITKGNLTERMRRVE